MRSWGNVKSAFYEEENAMKITCRHAVTFCVLVMLFVACGPSKRVKYEALYRAAKTLAASTSTGVNYSDFTNRVQALETEVMISKDKANTSDQVYMVAAYAKLLDIYKDSINVWKWKIDWPGYQFIWMADDLSYMRPVWVRPTISKYKLSLKNDSMGLGLPVDEALQKIWEAATVQAKIADDLYAK